jgi:hypothetical protein
MGWPLHAGVMTHEDENHMHCIHCERVRWDAGGKMETPPRTFVVIAKKPTQDGPETVQ